LIFGILEVRDIQIKKGVRKWKSIQL